MMRCMGMLGLLCLISAGCLNPQIRAQMAEELEKERDLEIGTIGDVTVVANPIMMKVQGVGLVTGLAGTGHCPAGRYRDLLEQYLLKTIGTPGGEISDNPHKLRVSKLLEDPNNALVIVTGHLPQGTRRGDRFEVDITLPHGSKTTSLAGGYLQPCLLRVYEAASNLSERHANSGSLLPSQVYAQARGPLMVGFGANTDSSELLHGRIWQGGLSRTDRPYMFVLKTDDKSVRISNEVAERINYMYQEDPRSRTLLSEQQKQILALGNITEQLNQRTGAGGLMATEMAKAVSKESLQVRVPFAYRHNHERYMRVARFTPIRGDDPRLGRYKLRLQKMLHDPRDTIRAAMRLEAMGRDGAGALREGLDSEYALVRFAAAESLAYLGNTAGVETLAEVAKKHPIFAHQACLALANLGELLCRDQLAALFESPEPAVRAAAFHALTLIDENDARLRGENQQDVFTIHRLPQSPANMVSFTASKHPRVLLFGRNLRVQPDSRFFVGKDFTVHADLIEDRCTVKITTPRGESKRVCSQRLDDILGALASLGATYPEVVEFLRKAHDYRKLNCPVTAWSLAETPLETLIEAGQDLR